MEQIIENAAPIGHHAAAAVLGIFAKHPIPGRVKTRLASQTSADFAALVAGAFLEDWIDRLSSFPVKPILVFDPPESASYFAGIAGNQFQLASQGDGDLGQRLARFFTQQFAAGKQSVVVLGGDSPTLPLAFIEQAFQELTRADIVLGPATDGGYYLIGATRSVPPVFEGMAWSRPTVLAETIARLADPTCRLALLPPWYDVDTLDDWRSLRGHLLAMRRAGFNPQAPRTERLALGPQP